MLAARPIREAAVVERPGWFGSFLPGAVLLLAWADCLIDTPALVTDRPVRHQWPSALLAGGSWNCGANANPWPASLRLDVCTTFVRMSHAYQSSNLQLDLQKIGGLLRANTRLSASFMRKSAPALKKPVRGFLFRAVGIAGIRGSWGLSWPV